MTNQKPYKLNRLCYNIQIPGMAPLWVMPGFLFILGGLYD